MGNLKRWSVTYTKHVKQKRKVYQDGYLELQDSGYKIMLYDEYDKLLETRFVKKDDVINSGESMTFDSYLVDIGEQCVGNKPFSSLNCQDNNKKVKQKLSSSCNHGYKNNSDRKPFFGERTRLIKLSPSQKIIREFKNSELNKYKSFSSPSFPDMTKSTKIEWQVLYTAQLTQKAKKFHDGFLQLIVRGSQGRQVMLYDTNRRLLDSRFLKKNELVKCGESLAFEGHLVEIGELEDHKLPIDLTPPETNHKIVGKNISDNQPEISCNEKFHAGQPQYNTSQKEHSDFGDSSCKVVDTNIICRTPTNVPKRAASEILSILRKPMIQEKLVSENKHLPEEQNGSHSLVHSDIKHHINIYAQNCNRSAEVKVIEEVFDDDCNNKILKCEGVEILNGAENCSVYENARRSQARSTAFHLSSGTINNTLLTCNVEGTDNSELESISSAAEPQILVTPTLNSFGQTTSTSASLMKANKNVELENPTQIISCKELGAKLTAASTNDFNSNILEKFCEENKGTSSVDHGGVHGFGMADSNNGASQDTSDVEQEARMYDFVAEEIAEFPSFDLGF
ncbi:uncharacterized protein [Primulina huaijiensis]|uniref:uncharacterized protein n=1 Tax=Primulina huaijiensis TaxID=1492673 RepID=UPI003CC757ED